MKKSISLITIFALVLAFTLTACNDESKSPQINPDTTANNFNAPISTESLANIETPANSTDSEPSKPTLPGTFPETFEYLGETFSIHDADDFIYSDGEIEAVIFNSFGYINTADGIIKVILGQEIDGLIVTRADVAFGLDYLGELTVTDTDVIFEGIIELTGRLYKVRNSIAEPSGFYVTKVATGIIPFGADYPWFLVWGDYDPEEDFSDIFDDREYAEVTATFGTIRLRETSRATGGNYIELTGITDIIN